MDYSIKLTPPLQKLKHKEGERIETYGAQWWLNRNIPGTTQTHIYEGVPTDAYMAQGHHGQILAVIPSKDLVVVRNGVDKDKSMNRGLFLKKLVEALP